MAVPDGWLFRGTAGPGTSAATWELIVGNKASDTSPHADSRRMAFDQAGNILEADDGGIYKLTTPNNGTNRVWSSLDTNLAVTEFFSVDYDAQRDVILGGAQDTGNVRQVNPADPNWVLTRGGDGQTVQIDDTTDPAKSFYYVSHFQLLGMQRLTVEKATGNVVDTRTLPLTIVDRNGVHMAGNRGLNDANINQDAEIKFVFDDTIPSQTPWVLNAVDQERMMIGSDFLYESFDKGETAIPLGGARDLNNDGIDNDFDGNKDGADLQHNEYSALRKIGGTVSALAYGGFDGNTPMPDIAWVATFTKDAGGKVIDTKLLLREAIADSAPTINPTNDDFHATAWSGGKNKIVDIALDPRDWKTAYILTTDGVFRTTDKGAHFEQLTGNLPSLATTALTGQDPATLLTRERTFRSILMFRGGTGFTQTALFVGGVGGVYRLRDVATTTSNFVWSRYGRDMPFMPASDLRLDTKKNIFVVGTKGRGAYETIGDQDLNAKATLNLKGDQSSNTYTIKRSDGSPLMLDLLVNGQPAQIQDPTTMNTEPLRIPLASVEQIVIGDATTSDQVTVDENNGAIDVPITFGGGKGSGDSINRINTHPIQRFFKKVTNLLSSVGTSLNDAVASSGAGTQNLPLVNTSLNDALVPSPETADNIPTDFTAGLEEDDGGGDGDGGGGAEEGDADSAPDSINSIADLFNTGFVGAVRQYLAFDPTPTLPEFAESLGGIRFTINGVTIDVDPSSVNGGEQSDRIEFGLTVRVRAVKNDLPIDLGLDAKNLGVSLDASAKVDLSAELDFTFNFGVSLDDSVADGSAFFFKPQSLTLTAAVAIPDLDVSLNVGFIGAQIQNGTLNLSAGLTAQFASAQMSEQDLEGAAGGFASFTPVGQLHANLPIALTFGSFSPTGSEQPRLLIDDSDLFDSTAPSFSAQNFDQLVDFNNITPEQILALIKQLASRLSQFKGTPLFSHAIPLTGGKTLGDVVDLGKALTDKLSSFIEGPDGDPTFDTAQGLVDKLSAALGLAPGTLVANYSPTDHLLTFGIDFSHTFPIASTPLVFDLDLSPIGGVTANANLNLNASADLNFIMGVDLSPLSSGQTLADRFFIQNATLAGQVALGASNFTANAKFGFIDIGVANGSANLGANLSLSLADPGTEPGTDGHITLTELIGAIASDPSSLAPNLSFDATADATLSGITINLPGLSLGGSPSVTVHVDIPGINTPPNVTVTPTGFEGLDAFKNLSITDIIHALHSLADYLSNLQSFSFLHTDIPGIHKSVSDLLDVADRFATKLDQFESNPAGALQQVETALETALGLGTDGVTLSVSQDPSTNQFTDLNIALKLPFTYNSGPLPLNLDLSSLTSSLPPGSQGIGSLVNVSGAGDLNITAGAIATLDFGLDFSGTGGLPRPFLRDDSNVSLTASATASNLNFDLTLGPIGAFVRNGSVALTKAIGSTDPMSFTVGLAPVTGDKYYVSDLLGDLTNKVTVGFDGAADLRLPLFFPDQSTPLGGSTADGNGDGVPDNELRVQIGDMTDIANTLQIFTPDIAGIFGNLDLLNNLGGVVNGIDTLLSLLQNALDSEVLGKRLPLVGDKLRDGARIIEDFRTNVLSHLQQEINASGGSALGVIQKALFDSIGPAPGGLNLLTLDPTFNDSDGDPNTTDTVPDFKDVAYEQTTDGNGKVTDVKFDLHLHKALTSASIPIDFDIGIPGLGLKVDPPSAVQASVGFDLDLNVGVNVDKGFYLDTSSPEELKVNLDVAIPNFHATGSLGFLQLDVRDAADAPTHFSGAFDVDLLDVGTEEADDKLTFDELTGGGFSLGDLVKATLTANAAVNLDLVVSLGGNAAFPSFDSRFVLNWNFASAPTDAPTLGSTPTIAFRNVGIDLGSFISNFAGPVLGKVRQILKPLQPIVDFLTRRLPVFSDISATRNYFDLNHDGKVTLLEMAQKITGGTPHTQFVSAVVEIFNLVNSIPTTGPIRIDLGDFVISGVDPRTQDVSSPAASPTSTRTASSVDQQLTSSGQTTAKNFVDQLESTTGSPIQFPLLKNPSSIISLFMGKSVDLFLYDMPPLDVGFNVDLFFPLLGPLGVTFSGSLGVKAAFHFGYDSSGLQLFKTSHNPLDIFNGFFVSDTALVNGSQQDISEVTVKGSIEAFGSVNAGVASAGVGGGVTATVDLNLNDPNHDGKVRLDELLANFPLCIFDISGSVTAGISAFVKIGFGWFSYTKHFDIADVTLLDFNYNCDDSVQQPDPILAQFDPSGSHTLRLNMGPHAGDRLHGDTTDGNETFTVSHVSGGAGNETVTVTAFGFTQTFTGVAAITADGGAGNDAISLDDGVLATSNLSGGVGNDTVTGGSGASVINGGAGDDKLSGRDANDAITGGDGNDQISGNAGNDSIDGQAGDDVIDGGDGNDNLAGGDDDDELDGGAGDDHLDGGFGNDQMGGGAGNDTVTGDAGNDNITGDEGNDSLSGGEGDDALVGGDGNDTLAGNEDNDSLDGAAGNDSIAGGDGNDSVEGGAGDDSIDGQDGNDTLNAGDGNDTVTGGNGADNLDGESGNDSLAGNDGADVINGGDGNDSLDGGLGNDTLNGEDGNDSATGGAGDDSLSGNTGNDTLSGDSGNDLLQGGTGDDSITGGTGNDTLRGNDGNDSLAGGDDADSVFGDFGNDTLAGNDGNDELHGGAGNDSITGDAGDDSIFGDAGNDTAPGSTGNDSISGGDGNDLLFGNEDNDSIFGDAGNDTASGNTGQDVIHGGADNDLLSGNEDNDSIFGDAGNDTASGNDGNDYIEGNAGNDSLSGGNGDDRIIGGSSIPTPGGDGNDTAHGDAGNDVILGDDGVIGSICLIGGNGKDLLFGDDGNDLIYGQGGDDTCLGGNDNDTEFGGAGNDQLFGQLGADLLYGEDDQDIIIGDLATLTPLGVLNPSGSTAFAVHLDSPLLGGADVISGGAGDDSIFAGAANDTASGDAGDDDIEGNSGNDVLNGGDGEDDIIGGSSDLSVPLVADRPDGADLIDGGAGQEVIAGDNARITRRLNAATNTFFRYTPGTPSGTGVGPENNAVIRDFTLLDLDTIGGNDTASGGAGDDIILGGLGDDNLAGNDGNDQLIGHLGADRLDGGNGHDALLGDKGTIIVDLLDGATARTIADSGHRLVALVDGQGYLKRLVVLEQPDIGGDDTLLGGAGDDVLHGGAGNDQMSGDVGDDALFGDLGNDNVNGGAGEDDLFGGGGNDALDGGADADIIYGGDGQDTLTADIAADNLVDWFGNFNLFIVPGPGFGAPTIIRSPDPSTQQFLLDLATGDGATNADGEIQVVEPPSPSNAGK